MKGIAIHCLLQMLGKDIAFFSQHASPYTIRTNPGIQRSGRSIGAYKDYLHGSKSESHISFMYFWGICLAYAAVAAKMSPNPASVTTPLLAENAAVIALTIPSLLDMPVTVYSIAMGTTGIKHAKIVVASLVKRPIPVSL